MEQACTAPAGGSPIPVVSLEELPRGALESMLEADREIDECYRVLKKAGLNIVGECLKGQGVNRPAAREVPPTGRTGPMRASSTRFRCHEL